MSDFDDFERYDRLDSEIGARMRDLAGGDSIDPSVTLATMRPSLHRARTRRRVGTALSAAALVASVSAIAVVINVNGSNGPKLDFQSSTSTPGRSSTTLRSASTTSVPSDSTTSTVNEGTTTPGQGSTGNSGSTNTTSGTVVPGTGGSTESSGQSSSTTDRGKTTTTVSATRSQTVSGTGGSVTVTWNSAGIVTRSNRPAPGFTAEIKQSDSLRYEVRFRDASHTTDVKVRVHNGALEPTVNEY